MPIKAENRHRYPSNWKQIRASELERAGHKCRRCRAPNHAMVARGAGEDEGTYMLDDGRVFDDTTGGYFGLARGSEYDVKRYVKIVLTIAHLDHTPENNDPSNLRALCQQCHLRHDAKHHAETRRRTRAARSGQLELGVSDA